MNEIVGAWFEQAGVEKIRVGGQIRYDCILQWNYGTNDFVSCREVVPISEVKLIIHLKHRCPL